MLAVETGDPNIPSHLSGSIAWPRQWVWVQRVAGTTGDSFAAFVGTICSAVEDHGDEWRVFLGDNLRGSTRFNILPQPAYQQKYGPIEYVIYKPINHLKIEGCEHGTYPGVNLPDPPQASDWGLLGLRVAELHG
eukprot:jgi/Psemu1/13481/gm1.13481_g